MATTRMDLRLDERIKAKAEKASALLGLSSLSEYVVRTLDADATKVIAEHESIVVSEDIFDRFMTACDAARAPNAALVNAAKRAQEFTVR